MKRLINSNSHLIAIILGCICYTGMKCYAKATYGAQEFFTPELIVVMICFLLFGFIPYGSVRRHGCKTLLIPGFTVAIFIIYNVSGEWEIRNMMYLFFVIGMFYGAGFDFLCSEPKEIKNERFGTNYKGKGRR